MKFLETALAGAYVIELERLPDDRGFFARSYCARDFSARGLNSRVVQCNVSFNERRGTLRGLHYQAKPHEEAKLVRCTRGAIYDVIVDLREGSSTYRKWTAVELHRGKRLAALRPRGFCPRVPDPERR